MDVTQKHAVKTSQNHNMCVCAKQERGVGEVGGKGETRAKRQLDEREQGNEMFVCHGRGHSIDLIVRRS